MSGATQGRVGSLPRLDIKEFARFGAGLVVVSGLVFGLAIPAAYCQDNDAAKGESANQKAYAAGARAYESGDMATAERQLTTALSGGGLPNSQMARALYLRGSALRRLGKPAQAISDLTTAVWLKGGLSDADKAKATEERQLAYQEAGLGNTPPAIGAASLDQSPSTPAAAGTPPGEPPKAKPGTQVAVVGPGGFWNNMSMPSMPTFSLPGLSSAPAAPAQPAQPQAPEPAQAFAAAPAGDVAAAAAQGEGQSFAPGTTVTAPSASGESAWQTETAAASTEAPASSFFAPQPTPVSTGLNAMPGASPAGQASLVAASDASPDGGTAWSNPLAGTGQAIGGFFGNMFGGSSSAAADDGAAPVTTGSTAAPGAWGSETKVVTSQTSSMVQRGPESPAPSAASGSSALPWSNSSSAAAAAPAARPTAAKQQVAARTTTGGKYKLQVASVRSREEADKLASTLQRYPAVRDGSVSTEVDEAVIGSMGTFYRVRLGPYATAKEPDDLCQTLKPQGFDCLVVTQ